MSPHEQAVLDLERANHRETVSALSAELTALRQRTATIVDEAYGLQPVMSADDVLTLLERKLFEDRQAHNALRADLNVARTNNWILEGDLGKLRADRDKLRADLAELQRDRDELARQAEADVEVNRGLDAEIAEAKATSDGLMVSINMMESQAAGYRTRNVQLLEELAEANARVAELASAADEVLGQTTLSAQWNVFHDKLFDLVERVRAVKTKAEAAKEPTA